jgi:hypothetical protein
VASPLQDSVGVITPSSLHYVATTRGSCARGSGRRSDDCAPSYSVSYRADLMRLSTCRMW